jgi:hypothetical protein
MIIIQNNPLFQVKFEIMNLLIVTCVRKIKNVMGNKCKYKKTSSKKH